MKSVKMELVEARARLTLLTNHSIVGCEDAIVYPLSREVSPNISKSIEIIATKTSLCKG